MILLRSVALFIYGSFMIILSFDDMSLLLSFIVTLWVNSLFSFCGKKDDGWNIFFWWIVISFVGYVIRVTPILTKYGETMDSIQFMSLPLFFLIDAAGILTTNGIRLKNKNYERILASGASLMDLINCCSGNPFLHRINAIVRLVLFLCVHGIEYSIARDQTTMNILPDESDSCSRLGIFLATHYTLYSHDILIIPLFVVHVITLRFKHKRLKVPNRESYGRR